MRDFGLPPRCELEICPSVVVHTAELAEARKCMLRHVFCVFMLVALHLFLQEISFNRQLDRQQQVQYLLCC